MLFVADLDRSVAFYTDVFGLKVIDREERIGVGSAAAPKRRGGVGLYHLAWQLDTIDELVELRERLVDAGTYTGESSHVATTSVYGADPDGNEFEIMWMLPREAFGEYADKGAVERLDLAAEVTRWSGVRTAGRIVTEAMASEGVVA